MDDSILSTAIRVTVTRRIDHSPAANAQEMWNGKRVTFDRIASQGDGPGFFAAFDSVSTLVLATCDFFCTFDSERLVAEPGVDFEVSAESTDFCDFDFAVLSLER